ncbi:MAG TPA: lysylphosphatidylglycerol synthase transmembrane domain-containing protein [Solirubrobacterales bacterium]|nr:lysylphosphatidylglycerol synthase transmembrane domain-containing protein [Solirubrobacterales bacterium]
MRAFRRGDPRPDAGAPPPGADMDDTQNGTPFGEPVTEEVESGMTFDRSRLITYALVVLVILVALYFVLPELTGLEDSLRRIEDADPVWIAVALGFNVLSFASYIALFRGILGGGRAMSPKLRERIDWRSSYQITLAGLAATRLFSAGGAGGIALTYWALRRAGMVARQAAGRMVAFLVLLYTVYLLALVICGIFLRVGLFPGPSPVGMTIVPAALAGAALIILFLLSLIPLDLDRIVARWAQGHRRVRMARRIATVPATIAAGTREALTLLRHPSSGLLAVIGAVGFWATNIAVLWACFHAFGEDVPKAVLVQGFFVGMTANLLPFFPGGVGSVDAGMIAAFLAFGEPSSTVFVSVLAYRVIAFWLPIPPGILAYLQLRRTVARWREEDAPRRAAAARAGPSPEPAT